MTSFNLPPGVTESMIPGNRPEDNAWNHFWDEFNFWDALYDWANKNNPMLVSAMNFIEEDNDIALAIVEVHEDDLPIEKWFDDWMNKGRMAVTNES